MTTEICELCGKVVTGRNWRNGDGDFVHKNCALKGCVAKCVQCNLYYPEDYDFTEYENRCEECGEELVSIEKPAPKEAAP